MKKNWFRTASIIVVFLVSIYYLLPLVVKSQHKICDIEFFYQDSIKIYEVKGYEYEIRSYEFGEEFDNVITSVAIGDSVTSSGNLSDDILRGLNLPTDFDYTQNLQIHAKIGDKISKVKLPSWFSQKQLKLGLDLKGGMHLVLEVETEGLSNAEAEESVRGAIDIIRNRIDQFGVAEPEIRKQGAKRILVQLPGLKDASRAKDLIGKTALLEFNLMAKNEDVTKTIETLDSYLKNNYEKFAFLKEVEEEEVSAVEEALLESPDEEADTIKADTTLVEEHNHIFKSLISMYESALVVKPENLKIFRKLLKLPEIKEIIPSGIKVLLGKVDPENIYGTRQIYFLYEQVELTGALLEDASVRIGGGASLSNANQPYVQLQFNNEGARKFKNVTGQHIKERLAIVLDNIVHSAPVIQDKIRGGKAQITGNFTLEEAKDLVIVLKAGNLPVPVHIIEERTVGPSLGSDSIKAGFKAALIGMIIVIIFMIFYYRLSGLIADFALFCNIVIIGAVLTMLNASLTLPGIAGIILTIGMAVDANVLIFERIREELSAGKTVRTAIDNGYRRAIITIADANITTLITAIVLYQFGTGPIKGFAVTLSIGILASMFTAIVLTRAIFDGFVTKKARKTLSI